MARAVLETYSLNTGCLHAHRLPARIPTPHRARHCGLTRQKLHLQDPQFWEEILTHDRVNSFVPKKKKILSLSLFTVIRGRNLILLPGLQLLQDWKR